VRVVVLDELGNRFVRPSDMIRSPDRALMGTEAFSVWSQAGSLAGRAAAVPCGALLTIAGIGWLPALWDGLVAGVAGRVWIPAWAGCYTPAAASGQAHRVGVQLVQGRRSARAPGAPAWRRDFCVSLSRPPDARLVLVVWRPSPAGLAAQWPRVYSHFSFFAFRLLDC